MTHVNALAAGRAKGVFGKSFSPLVAFKYDDWLASQARLQEPQNRARKHTRKQRFLLHPRKLRIIGFCGRRRNNTFASLTSNIPIYHDT